MTLKLFFNKLKIGITISKDLPLENEYLNFIYSKKTSN